ncbi:MAG: right-handed parallel beta-helix repeat-containing protein [Thermoguttaceae bacterium]|nr:right-handed parallel beta-helix repeat-containing protein [Thermoguttaceae bacterium]
MPRIFTLIALLAVSSLAAAADYYLDPAGSDDRDGTTPETAWRSLDKITFSGLIQPGDRVLLKRGGLWRGCLEPPSGTPEAPIYYGPYGEGEKPTIYSSVDLTDPDDWIAPPEGSSIWKSRPVKILSAEPIPTDRIGWSVWTEEGASGSLNAADFDGQAGWKYRCRVSGPRGCSTQLIAAAVPISRELGVTMKLRLRASRPLTLNNITINKRSKPWDRWAESSPKTVEVTEEWTDAELHFLGEADDPNARLTIFAGSCIPDDTELDIILVGAEACRFEPKRLGKDVGNIILTPREEFDPGADRTDDTHRRAAFKRWKLEDLKQNDDFWYDKAAEQIYYFSDVNPALKYGECEAALSRYAVVARQYQIFEDLAIGYAGRHGIAGLGSKGCVVRGCDIFWIGGAEIGGFSSPTRFGNGIEFWGVGEDHLVENCRVWQVYDVAFSIQGRDPANYKNIVWRNNTVWNCEQSFEVWLSNPESRITDCVFEYNRCYDSGFGWSHVQRPDKNGTHLLSYAMLAASIDFKFRHNIFCHARNGLTRFSNDRIAEFDIDQNTWWQPEEEGVAGVDQPLFLWGLGRKADQEGGGPRIVPFERYREMTGNDARSVFAEPPAPDKGPIAPLR